MERSEELSHGGATGFRPPEGISFQRIPNDKSLASMLVNRELDVAPTMRAFARESNIIDRSTQIRARGGDWSKVKVWYAPMGDVGLTAYPAYGFIYADGDDGDVAPAPARKLQFTENRLASIGTLIDGLRN